MPHRIIWSWYTGCYIWYSEEGTRRGRSPPWPLLAIPNVTAKCNAVSAGSPIYITDKLQCVLNTAARLVTGTHKFDHGLSRAAWGIALARRPRTYPLQTGSHSASLSAEQCFWGLILLSTWSIVVHQSRTFPADVIYGQPLDIIWPYHVTGSIMGLFAYFYS